MGDSSKCFSVEYIKITVCTCIKDKFLRRTVILPLRSKERFFGARRRATFALLSP